MSTWEKKAQALLCFVQFLVNLECAATTYANVMFTQPYKMSCMHIIERFVTLLNDMTAGMNKINKAWHKMVAKKDQCAAVVQCQLVRGRLRHAEDGLYEPSWTTLYVPEASKASE